jgi:hypothetical protein
MKKTVTITFQFDDRDACPWKTQLSEAFNRCWNFAPELWYEAESSPERRAFNRIVNCGEFELSESIKLRQYAYIVYGRTLSASRELRNQMIHDSLRQAADNLVNVMDNFKMEVERVWHSSPDDPQEREV